MTTQQVDAPQGWGVVKTVDGQHVTIKPFMRRQEVINDWVVRSSWSTYHPHSLLWKHSCEQDTASEQQFQDRCKMTPILLREWQKFLSAMQSDNSRKKER